ncbi:MAG: hypothetical protein ACJ8OJ_06210 [Povalibacter sp.]
MSTVVTKLVRKELYINRQIMQVVTVAGLLSVWLAAHGQFAFNLGMLAWMTAIISLGVILALSGVVRERKDRALLFVMSLPISAHGYLRAKQSGLLLCFALPWFALSTAAVLLVLWAPSIVDGVLPFAVLFCIYLFANFVWVLAGVLITQSEALVGLVIIATNMSISVFMMIVSGLPTMQTQWQRANPLWDRDFWSVLAVEVVLIAIGLAVPRIIAAYRRGWT